MKVHQLSIFIENKTGRLEEITKLLGVNNINILGFSVADTADYGIFRIIVPDPKKTKEVIKSKGFTVIDNEVICLKAENSPGELAKIISIFSDKNINIEYMYGIINSLIIFKVDRMEEAIKLLKMEKLKIVSQEEIETI